MSFQILQRAYAPYGTAAQFPASGDSRLIYRATDTGYLYTWDASESAYKLAGIDPATAPYLGLHAQADDAARLGGQLPSYYAQAGHTHTFAGLTSKPTTLAGYGITDAAAASHTHSGYETAIGNPSANGYLLSSTSAGVRSWVAHYSHPATHAQSVIDSSSGWITTALAGKQAAGSYLTTTGTAADSAKLGGVAASGYSQTSHTHNYAGSSTPGGSATTAEKLSVARTITIGAKANTFDGSADKTYSLSDVGAVAETSGTWTLGISADTAPTGASIANGYAIYNKIGVMCFITFGFEITSVGNGGAGNIRISTLPFYVSARYSSGAYSRATIAISVGGAPHFFYAAPESVLLRSMDLKYSSLTPYTLVTGSMFYETA